MEEVNSEVYVGQPKGYSDGSNKVCKLRKALYGLRESPRAWYKCLNEYLTKIKFKAVLHLKILKKSKFLLLNFMIIYVILNLKNYSLDQ